MLRQLLLPKESYMKVKSISLLTELVFPLQLMMRLSYRPSTALLLWTWMNPQRGIPEDKTHKEAVMGDRKPDILLVESLTPTRSLLGIYGASVRPSWR